MQTDGKETWLLLCFPLYDLKVLLLVSGVQLQKHPSPSATDEGMVTENMNRQVVVKEVEAEVNRRQKCQLTVGLQLIGVEVFTSHLLHIIEKQDKTD